MKALEVALSRCNPPLATATTAVVMTALRHMQAASFVDAVKLEELTEAETVQRAVMLEGGVKLVSDIAKAANAFERNAARLPAEHRAQRNESILRRYIECPHHLTTLSATGKSGFDFEKDADRRCVGCFWRIAHRPWTEDAAVNAPRFCCRQCSYNLCWACYGVVKPVLREAHHRLACQLVSHAVENAVSTVPAQIAEAAALARQVRARERAAARLEAREEALAWLEAREEEGCCPGLHKTIRDTRWTMESEYPVVRRVVFVYWRGVIILGIYGFYITVVQIQEAIGRIVVWLLMLTTGGYCIFFWCISTVVGQFLRTVLDCIVSTATPTQQQDGTQQEDSASRGGNLLQTITWPVEEINDGYTYAFTVSCPLQHQKARPAEEMGPADDQPKTQQEDETQQKDSLSRGGALPQTMAQQADDLTWGDMTRSEQITHVYTTVAVLITLFIFTVCKFMYFIFKCVGAFCKCVGYFLECVGALCKCVWDVLDMLFCICKVCK